MAERHAITGAFGFSGRYIAERLLDQGHEVITLTNAPSSRDSFANRIRAYPLSFDQPSSLEKALEGSSVLYNTYYVRFNYRGAVAFSYEDAVKNSEVLFAAAKKAGIGRIVHISITNPSESSPFEYFRGKARIERSLIESGLSYSILRPAILFGSGSILINNIAWLLRHFPVFGVFGNGSYRLQPIHVDDLASLAVKKAGEDVNDITNAIGPETFTYRGLVETIGKIIGKPRPTVSIPPTVGFWTAKLLGIFLHDRLITRDEIQGLMRGLLYVDAPSAGRTKLTEWVRENRANLGRNYASELARRIR